MPEGPAHKTLRETAAKILERYGGNPSYADRDVDIIAYNGRMRIEVQTAPIRRDLIADLYGRPTVFIVPESQKERVIYALRKLYQRYDRALSIPVLGISEFEAYLQRTVRQKETVQDINMNSESLA
jgi:hypothetical protein